jgi:hypothetical protein
MYIVESTNNRIPSNQELIELSGKLQMYVINNVISEENRSMLISVIEALDNSANFLYKSELFTDQLQEMLKGVRLHKKQ